MRLGHSLLLTVLLLCLYTGSEAQSYVFARLAGNPVDTAGWNFVGGAQLADTRGDADFARDEVMVCPLQQTFSSGAVFYRSSLNLGSCQKFEAEFDYRLFDGQIGPTGADGMAFCFLTEPPRTFLTGGGIGIPSRPQGLMVVLDPWCNCCQNGPETQKIEIRYGNGAADYNECPNPAQPTAIVSGLRRNTYRHMRIRYDNGLIEVFLDTASQPILTGNYRINFSGFFGFTAATGSRVDNHSIRNFVLRSIKPLTPPNAGRDFRICSGDTMQLGGNNRADTNLIYRWSPTFGVQDPNAGVTRISIVNTGAQEIARNYFLTKDSLGRDADACVSSDGVLVISMGTGVDLPATLRGCDGQMLTIPFTGFSGYQYSWEAGPGIETPTKAPTRILLSNPTDQPITRKYILKARAAAYGCFAWAYDTVAITINPTHRRAGADVVLCSGDQATLGQPALPGLLYNWSPAAGLSNPTLAQPSTSLSNSSSTPFDRQFVLFTTNPATGCVGLDTALVRVNPLPSLQLTGFREICAGTTITIGDPVPHQNRYLWQPGRGLSDSTVADPVFPTSPIQLPGTFTFTLLTMDSLTNCRRTDTVRIQVKAMPVAEAGPADTVCAATSLVLGDAGTPGATYAWTPQQFLDLPATASPRLTLPSDTLPRTLHYRLIASLEGCTARDSVAITVLPQPVARILPLGPACVGDSLRMHAVRRPGNSYLWPLTDSLAGPDVAIPLILGGVTFWQSLEVTGPNGCTARDSILVSPNLPPAPLAGPEHEVCALDTIQLGLPPVPGLTYQWRPVNGLSGTGSAQPMYIAFNYSQDFGLSFWVRLQTDDPATGCRTVDSTKITVKQAPRRYAGPDVMFCAGATGWIGADSVPGHQYLWTNTPLSYDSAYRSVTLGPDTVLREFYFSRRATLNSCSLLDTVTVVSAPQPAYRPNIIGRNSICPNLVTDYYLRNAPRDGYAYAWLAEGGTLFLHVPATDTLTMHWGPANPNAFVAAFAVRATDSVSCIGDTVRLPVNINPTLRAPLPQGATCIGLENSRSGYSVDSMPGSTYVWGMEGPATLLSGQGTDSITVDFNRRGIVRLWIDEQINNTACAGPSDTITVRIMTAPNDRGTVAGDTGFCIGDTIPFRFDLAFVDSRLDWSVVNPAYLTATAGDSARFVFPQAGHSAVSVVEFNGGCSGTAQVLPLQVHSLPIYTWASADSILCPEALAGHNYRISTDPGTRFRWQVQGGQATGSEGDSISVSVDWRQAPYRLSVTGTNQHGCSGAPRVLAPLVDQSSLDLVTVTHVEENNQDIAFSIRIAQPFLDGSRSGTIQRLARTEPGAVWQDFAPLDFTPSEQMYTVSGQYQPENQYSFRLNTMRACGLPQVSDTVTPIYLQVSADEASGDVQAWFNPYRLQRLPLGFTIHHGLHRQTDGGPWAGIPGQLAFEDTATTLQADGRLGFELCYRVIAYSRIGATLSLSNKVCTTFENKVSVPNVLTPDGDGKNDRFDPLNLRLYQGQSTLDIHNRWGKPVLHSTDYRGAWPAADTAPGLYFYHLSYPKGVLKGWVEVVQ